MTPEDLHASLRLASTFDEISTGCVRYSEYRLSTDVAERIAIEYAEARVAEATADLQRQLDQERSVRATAEQIAEASRHFDWAAALAKKDMENARLKEQEAELRGELAIANDSTASMYSAMSEVDQENARLKEQLDTACRAARGLTDEGGRGSALLPPPSTQRRVTFDIDEDPSGTEAAEPTCPLCHRPRSDWISPCSHAFHALRVGDLRAGVRYNEPVELHDRIDDGTELRTWQAWDATMGDGIRIMDPDGFRDGMREEIEPMTRERFLERRPLCTMDHLSVPLDSAASLVCETCGGSGEEKDDSMLAIGPCPDCSCKTCRGSGECKVDCAIPDHLCKGCISCQGSGRTEAGP